jgi:hypothetical protein
MKDGSHSNLKSNMQNGRPRKIAFVTICIIYVHIPDSMIDYLASAR